ncbi:MAG: SAM-dependent methyltransferase [Deltaproteobacteria bacterium]|nr:SAM-dependent methyltransferase [Deltaproteobacteria bacterium]MBK8240104.1 SAM-dependent methyltransferase [Deltaproteobacteria bacterium]MBK8715906.1 SAM-dependent methyltransferase [Deltaproteobacteria bacterium]MBP7286638.1 SAM-dependent methyltransferase [Nannocystaceae bacterium]
MTPDAPTRTVICGDALVWLATAELGPAHAVVTSMPDHSEIGGTLDAWRTWFIDAARLCCTRVHPDAVAIFYQSDIKHDGRWIDKGHLVHTGADQAGASCLFHRIVCRKPAGTLGFGRPLYTHVLAFSVNGRLPQGHGAPDVLPELGEMTWSRAMGTQACDRICEFLRSATACRTVVDPFCGVGTMLAVANRHGFAAVGVERSPKRARKAGTLTLP